MFNSIFLLALFASAFYLGFTVTSWILGNFRDKFESDREYNLNMLAISGICLFTLYFYLSN